jgi:hypothetical protein
MSDRSASIADVPYADDTRAVVKPSPVHTGSRLNVGGVEGVLTTLLTQRNAGAELILDFRDVEVIERMAGSVLANALTGTLGDAPLVLRVSGEQIGDLISAGLAFAFANRRGKTSVDATRFKAPDWSAWSYDWRPTSGTAPDELFDPSFIGETAVRPDVRGAGFAAFVNPHLSTPRVGEHPVSTVLWPWLDGLLRDARQGVSNRSTRESFIADIGGFVDETIINISDHAAPTSSDVVSLVHLSVTRGGGVRSGNRLHICVQDTGPGIIATARPKLGAEHRSLDDETLLAELFKGSVAHWGRGRGQGLPRIAEICQARGGTVRVFTQHLRLTLDASADDLPARASTAPFPIGGTVVALTVPLVV